MIARPYIKKQGQIILVLEKKVEMLKKELEKEHFSVEEQQLAFRVHTSTKERDLC